MSCWESVARCDVERVCSYMKDDRKIALYFGIPKEAVARVRSTLPRPREVHVGEERYDGTQRGSSGLNAHIVAEEIARSGSQRLNERLQDLFRKWEHEHGFQPGAGEKLLPAGYRP